MKTTLKLRLTLAAIGIATGCTTNPRLSNDNLSQEAYKLAVLDAAVIENTEIVGLPTISGERARVVTWTGYPDAYPAGAEVRLKWGNVWVTLDNAVKQRCQGYDRETLVSDIQKLLGLPIADKKRSFVTLMVPVESIFRPCANPAVTAETCSAEIPEDASSAHKEWYAEQAATSYQLPSGFPWTRLGYTYNWNDGESEIGPAEFVIRKGATVKVISVSTTEAYCSD